jgi:hypothetical protein
MAIATTTQRENVAIAYGQAAAYVSLHTADPGATGANEVTGGGYARAALTWTAGPTDGQISATATVTATAGVAVTHAGLWTAVSGGTFLDKAAGAATSTGTVSVTLTFAES